MKKIVTERALLQRLNRFLEREEGQLIRKCREDSRDYHNLGDYYLCDISTSGVIRTHVDIEELAREMKVLSKLEKVKN